MEKNFLSKTDTKIFLTIFLVYLFFISDYGGNWMADSLIDSAMAFVDTGSFIIDDYIKAPQDNAFFNGHYYSGFAPGASFLVMPLYLLVKPLLNLLPSSIFGFTQLQFKVIIMNILATVFLTIPASALLSVLIYRFLDNFTTRKKHKLLITFFFAFGTIIFVHSTGFYRRPITLFLAFLSFYIMYKIKNNQIRSSPKILFLIGFLLGLSIFIEYSMFIIVGLLSLYLLTFLRNKKIFWYCLGILIPLIALMVYHYIIFDDPFTTPYMHRANPKAQSIKSFSDVLTLNLSSERAFELTFGLSRGLFISSPILLLSILGLFYFFRSKSKRSTLEIALFALISFSYFLFNVSQVNIWEAGCSFGPRFMIQVLPFLIIPLIFTFSRINTKFILFFGIVSIFVNLLPILYGITGLWRGVCGAPNPIKEYLLIFIERGLTNYTLNLMKFKLLDIPVLWINLITILGLLILSIIIYLIWKRN